MASLFNGLFGGSEPSAAPAPVVDSDFADFAEAADPSPVAFSAIPTTAGYDGPTAIPTSGPAVPYSKWYNVHERHSLSEFKQEGVILALMLVVVAIHLYGTTTNRKKSRAWITAHAPVLQSEFALVGFGGRRQPTVDEIQSEGLAKTLAGGQLELPEVLLKEKSPNEFSTYASGRANVAFVDVNLKLLKRYNPFSLIMEYGMSMFFDTMQPPTERMEAILYGFDGKEASMTISAAPGAHELRKDTKSTYDNFVWAIVNKDTMKQLREDRYDVSITGTKDTPKLPTWATVMSESAEVTDFMLTPELIKAVEQAGDLLEHIIITDQPNDQPTRLNDTIPKKRVCLSLRLPSSGDYTSVLPIFSYFLRVTDLLVAGAHFRPEVLRKVRTTREDAVRRLQKADEDEKAEERAIELEKAKKTKRDTELRALNPKQQKKYLEKEKERSMKKQQKKQTQKA